MTDARPSPATADRANTFPWPPVLLVAVIAAAWLLTSASPLPWPGLSDTPARVVGLAFGLVGIALIAWAVLTLRRHGTTVMPDQTSTVLVTDGPYTLLRNPIYLGEAMILLSVAEISKSFWYAIAAGAFAVLVTQLQILSEERHLETRFGDDYRAYKARTRRWI